MSTSKYKDKKALVVGLGKSGTSVSRFLCSQNCTVTVTDLKSKSDLAESIKSLADLKIEFELGKHNPKTFTSVDFIVLSPGVPSNIEGLAEAKAAGIPIINDIEIAYPFINAPIIAVTGTNGKTTTTTLISDMLQADGKTVFTGGNIGVPICDLLNSNKTVDVVVLELSSFQLESIDTFKPNITVYTNLEPDHLDRYPQGIESYYNAKRRLLKNADQDTILITNLDNDKTSRLKDNFPGKTFLYSRRNPINISPSLAEKFQGAYLHRPKMIFKHEGTEESYDIMGCKLPGDHNKENLLAALTAVKLAGCSPQGIQKTIDTFRGVPHRLEFIRKKDGVAFYNDSKATNVASVTRSLNSFFAPIILIAGGRDKDQDFSVLSELVKKRVKNLILIGEAKEMMNRAIGDFSETFLVGTFEEAVLLAYQKSRTGDVILLSPACASYDMFKNYEERGEYFKKLVVQL